MILFSVREKEDQKQHTSIIEFSSTQGKILNRFKKGITDTSDGKNIKGHKKRPEQLEDGSIKLTSEKQFEIFETNRKYERERKN